MPTTLMTPAASGESNLLLQKRTGHGKHLRSAPDPTTLVFSNRERGRMERAFAAQPHPNPYHDPMDAQIFASRQLYLSAPLWFLRALRRLATDATAPGFLYVKNGPRGFVPDTPMDGNEREEGDFIATFFLMGVMQELGVIFTNRGEKRGNIPANIIPIQGMGATKSNAGYKEPLGMHTENPHLADSRQPNFVGLYTRRGDPERRAETMVTEARTIASVLDAETTAELRKPNFVIKMSESFKSGVRQSNPMPILYGPEDMPTIRTEFNATECLTPRAHEAFVKLTEVAERHATAVRLEMGDLLVTCNQRCIHGRGRFSPDFLSGQRRWLIRICTVANLFAARDTVAPGAYRAFDLAPAFLRDMIIHCSGVLDIPQLTPADLQLQQIRAALKAYDNWLNANGVPPSAADLPDMELVLFFCHTIASGGLVDRLSATQRYKLARVIALHAELEFGLKGIGITINPRTLEDALLKGMEFTGFLLTCLASPNQKPNNTSELKGETSCSTL